MKKVYIVIVLVMLILCACNQQSDNEGKPTETIEFSTSITSNDEAAINNADEKSKPHINSQANNSTEQKESINPELYNEIKSEIEQLYTGLIAKIDIRYDEISNDKVVDCLLTYPTDIEPEKYVSQLTQAKSIISRYETDKSSLIVVTIHCPSYKGDIITLGRDDTLFLFQNLDKLNNIINDSKPYLTLNDASKALNNWLKPLEASSKIKFLNLRIVGQNVYYMYSASLFRRDLFFVNASDGSISLLFDGEEYVPVKYATQKQIDAVLSFLNSQNNNYKLDKVKALLINNKYVDLLTNEVYASFLLKESNGKAIAEPYEEYTGE